MKLKINRTSGLRIVSPITPDPTTLAGRFRAVTGNGKTLKTFPTYALAHAWIAQQRDNRARRITSALLYA